MIIELVTLRKIITQFSEGLIPRVNIDMAAEQIWSTIHEMADANQVLCPKCHKGTLRPCNVRMTDPQTMKSRDELALGCDECQYKETAS